MLAIAPADLEVVTLNLETPFEARLIFVACSPGVLFCRLRRRLGVDNLASSTRPCTIGGSSEIAIDASTDILVEAPFKLTDAVAAGAANGWQTGPSR